MPKSKPAPRKRVEPEVIRRPAPKPKPTEPKPGSASELIRRGVEQRSFI